jgi:hypothetical protein
VVIFVLNNKRGAAEWYWIMIGMIIAIVVAIFILMLFTDFGEGIRASFDGLLGLTDTTNIPPVYGSEAAPVT